MKKILVIGTSGSGKSTLAKQLSELLEIQFFPSDHFYWEPGWKLAPSEKVFEQVKNVVSQEQWILDGNFEAERELVWKQADCIVWLDYSLAIILKQVAIRNFRWLLTRQSTWSSNRMTFQRAVSGIKHTTKTYWMKKESYPSWLTELHNVKVHRFCKKQDTEIWLKSLRE